VTASVIFACVGPGYENPMLHGTICKFYKVTLEHFY